MPSGLGSIFTAKPRQAETTDTRQGIRRHDPDYERRKKKKKTAEEELFNQQDHATVSTAALSMFLQNFLKSLESDNNDGVEGSAPAPAEAIDISPEAQDATNPNNAVSGKAAQAANAYQTTVQSSQRFSSILDSTDKTTPDLNLEANEVRTIHTLLVDLKYLTEKNIEYVEIQRGDNFLQSIVDAVTRAKHKI